MASMTLDQDKQRFAEWRSQRQQRQPIPDELWHLACNHISTLGITRVAREFRLNDTKLREKAWRPANCRCFYRRETLRQPRPPMWRRINTQV